MDYRLKSSWKGRDTDFCIPVKRDKNSIDIVVEVEVEEVVRVHGIPNCNISNLQDIQLFNLLLNSIL